MDKLLLFVLEKEHPNYDDFFTTSNDMVIE